MNKKNISLAGILIAGALLFSVTGCGKEELADLKNQLQTGIGVVEESSSQAELTVEEPAITVPEVSETENTEETEIAGTEKTTVNSVSADRYVYQTLSAEEKIIYDEVYDAISRHQEKVTISTLEPDMLDKAYKAVTSDYGELFWASGYVYTQYTKGDKLVSMDFAPKYIMTEGEAADMQQQIDAVVNQILAGISMEASDYEKARYIFEYLTTNISYQTGAANNQNIISVFINRATVCQGYASATQYLLEKLGIQTAIVTGTANGESHAWNLVKLDGEYYYIDTTWGNSSYSSDGTGMGKYVNYNYFAVTTEELQKTHTANDNISLPNCTAVADNYYIREGFYYADWNPDGIGNLFSNAYNNQQGTVSVKLATPELYQQTVQYFISEQHISDYCSGLTSLYYLEDNEQNVLTIKF